MARRRVSDESPKWSAARGLIDTSVRRDLPLRVIVEDELDPEPLDFHIHQELEVGVVLSGQVERHFEDLVSPVNRGDVWLCGPWELHAWRIAAPGTGQVVLTFLSDLIQGEMLGEIRALALFTVPPEQRPRVLTPEKRQRVLSLAQQVRTEARSRGHAWLSAVRLILLQLLLTLRRDWEPQSLPSPDAGVRATRLARIMPAVAIVNKDPMVRMSTAQAAAACKLSRSHFCHLFRQTMGLSFATLCRRLRLAAVAHRLLTTDQAAAAIAREAGFADGSHLHRAFLEYYGCTPGQYRARQQGGASTAQH